MSKVYLQFVFLLMFSTVSLLINIAGAQTKDVVNEPLPLEILKEFTDAFATIKTDYVEDIDDKTILKNAIKGMLSGLDPHSTYLDATAYKHLKEGTTGEFGGLGIEVGTEDGMIKVISPIDDTPAQRAGIQPGDLIFRIDDKSVKDMTMDESIKIMRGKPGTEIKLSIIREGLDKPLIITLKRAVIKVKSVKSRLLDKSYGYIRISSFQSRTANQLKKAIKKLTKETQSEQSSKKSEAALKGLILDLRNNPGGVLNGSVAVADTFLNEGLIVYTKGRVKDSNLKFSATHGDMMKGAPIVVLVNAGSASASEIVAGALQDQKRAVIMGSDTFGKGSVQTIKPLTHTTAVKLTTARYYTPSGRSIQAEGIVPDITLANISLKKSEHDSFVQVKEADLKGHLEQTKAKDKDKDKDKKQDGSKKSKNQNKSEKPAEETDYGLHEALNLLKGMSILNTQKTYK